LEIIGEIQVILHLEYEQKTDFCSGSNSIQVINDGLS